MLDEIDIKILEELFRVHTVGKSTTTYQSAKRIFKLSDRNEITDKAKFIQYRLKRLSKLGIVDIRENGKYREYRLVPNKCFFSEGCVQFEIDGKKIEIEMDKFVVVNTKDGWLVKQIR